MMTSSFTGYMMRRQLRDKKLEKKRKIKNSSNYMNMAPSTENSSAESFSKTGTNESGAKKTMPKRTSSSTTSKPFSTTNSSHLPISINGAGNAVFLVLGTVYVLFGGSVLYKLGMLALAAAFFYDTYILFAKINGSKDMIQQVILSESSPYTVLSVALYLLPASSVVLLPLLIRALYSTVMLLRSLPAVTKSQTYRKYAYIGDRLIAVNPQALLIASNIEVAVLPWLLLSVFSTGLIMPLVYFLFIRWQYAVNARTRIAIGAVDDAATKAMAHPSCPPVVRESYSKVRAYLAVPVIAN